MSRWVEVSSLVGTTEAARRLGYGHPQHIHWLRIHDPTFPDPVAEIGRQRVWVWEDVRRWAQASGRLAEAQEDEHGHPSAPAPGDA